MHRRTFLQMAAAALATSAHAEPPRLEPKLSAQQGPGGSVLLRLTLHNPTDKPVDVLLVASRAGNPKVTVEGQVLTAKADLLDTQMISRAGPRRTWWPIPAGAAWEAGQWELHGENLTFPCTLAFEMALQTRQGQVLLRLDQVSVQPA